MVYVKASQPSPTYLVNRVGVGNGVLLAFKKKRKIRNTVSLLHLNIRMHNLHTVLQAFLKVLAKIIFLIVKSLSSR